MNKNINKKCIPKGDIEAGSLINCARQALEVQRFPDSSRTARDRIMGVLQNLTSPKNPGGKKVELYSS